jgi:hypothetical protein
VRRYTVQSEFGFGKNALNVFGAQEALFALQHKVRGLGASSAGLLGILNELGEAFGAVLRPFDAGMEAVLGHKCDKDYICFLFY